MVVRAIFTAFKYLLHDRISKVRGGILDSGSTRLLCMIGHRSQVTDTGEFLPSVGVGAQGKYLLPPLNLASLFCAPPKKKELSPYYAATMTGIGWNKENGTIKAEEHN